MSSDTLHITPPALPNGAAPLHGTGQWSAVGGNGVATLEIALPISPIRGYTPSMTLAYHSSHANGPFGLGWTVPIHAISRRTSCGVPTYTAQDGFVGPDAQDWLPERHPDGVLVVTHHTTVNGIQLDTSYTVTRYFPRVESRFNRIEHWHSAADTAGFWRVQAADGSQHFYGKTRLARIADPDQPHHVAQWLLQESLSPHGEHIYYHYQQETDPTRHPRDCRAQRYLQTVYYGNSTASDQEALYLWQTEAPPLVKWHFQLLFDYGERALELDQQPTFQPTQAWASRSDPCSDFSFGFELRTLRLCQQVLMFHHFPDEATMGADPVLVRRLLLEYRQVNTINLLVGIHEQAFDSAGNSTSRPPLECFYQSSTLQVDDSAYKPFSVLPGLNDGIRYHLVDLYGEAIPGCLYREAKNWYYREPIRPAPPHAEDDVIHGPARSLSPIPVADETRQIHQALVDVDGDGRLDWLVAQPGMNGVFSLNEQGDWSTFTPFDAFPQEFFHRHSVFVDLIGAGQPDLAMIGPRSVRLYAHHRRSGFAPAIEVRRAEPDDDLPVISSSPSELVAFSDVLASGQQHLVRIRHDEIKCWPTLGRGRFAKGFVLGTLPFSYQAFKAANVWLADLDGSGGADLLYATTEHLWIFLNNAGNGFATEPIKLAWPAGIRHDNRCQVSLADVQGLGCPSLILTAAHQSPTHWRYDFFAKKPWLLARTYNNMGARTSIRYRSSAQEWLDEKHQLMAASQPAISHLPFALQLVSQRLQLDEITGNRLIQRWRYRHAYYDRKDREFRGFGLLLQTDVDRRSDPQATGFRGPLLRKTWFHTGHPAESLAPGHSLHDPQATTLASTLVSRYRATEGASPLDHHDDLIDNPGPLLLRDAARALQGTIRRVEVIAADAAPDAVPYSVHQYRYLVRLLAPATEHSVHARLLPVPLESISRHYEGVADDPVCQHQIHLRRDAYGSLVHGVTIHYARRKTANDAPPSALSDEHQQRWWRDTHDSAQQRYYLTETLAQYIHLDGPQDLRLALPYRQRDNVLVKDKAPATDGLTIEQLSYEGFIAPHKGPLAANAKRQLSRLSVQRYREAGESGKTLKRGIATLQALADYVETAALDEHALSVYRSLPVMPDAAVIDLAQRLKKAGYSPMTVFFSFAHEEPHKADTLWSRREHARQYEPAKAFYRVKAIRETQSEDKTRIFYDRYWLLVTAVKTPDTCLTTAEYDYRLLMPNKIVDPNGRVQEALYDGFGQLSVSTFHRQEQGLETGFSALQDYAPLHAVTPDFAIANTKHVVQRMASFHCYDPFSWMGVIDKAYPNRAQWIANRHLLPSGHITTRTRLRLKAPQASLSDDEKELKTWFDASRQTPVHGLTLQADRYPDETGQQVAMTLTHWDGFGRPLQRTQTAEPGPAHVVTNTGDLSVKDSMPQTAHANSRWCMSERTEYDLEGRIVRLYRPCFSDCHGYINDESLRRFWHCDTQFYDPLGRPIRTVTASAGKRQNTYWAWYTVSEDENDTQDSA